MNRPNIHDYIEKQPNGKVDVHAFKCIHDFEKYCDVLEKAFELACNHASCQFMKIEDEWCEHTEERNYEEDCLKCLRTHFLKEAQNETV